ncbi:MAG: hypothetical protein QOH41_3258 [Blastocatellia bacterium]|nr:hypothetical protein [Blastocatellia bacterium]
MRFDESMLSPFSSGRRAGDEGLPGNLLPICLCGGRVTLDDRYISGVDAALRPLPQPFPKERGRKRRKLI